MTEFTKEHLLDIRMAVGEFVTRTERNLAAFALALMERAENAEAERDRLKGELDLLTIAVNDAYEVLPDGTILAVETDESAVVTWPTLANGPEVLAAIRRACARRKKKGEL